jgi:hypothetical protein
MRHKPEKIFGPKRDYRTMKKLDVKELGDLGSSPNDLFFGQ